MSSSIRYGSAGSSAGDSAEGPRALCEALGMYYADVQEPQGSGDLTSVEGIQIATRAVGDDAIPTVNARDLHKFLGVGKDFATWIKDHVNQYDFAEGLDFVKIITTPQIGGAGNRGVKTEYHITLDMAKALSMAECNNRGKLVRQCLIFE